VAISGRERRLKLQTNHVLSRRIVEAHPASLIGLEDLNGIRERTKRRTKRRKGMQLVPPCRPKPGKPTSRSSTWAFAELLDLLVYKAALAGSRCVKVDAYCTSQQCPHCGHTSQANRPDRGLLFVCQACRYQLHADLIGARNIVLRTLLVRQDWISTGTLSGCRDGADQEAKAACRRRYAELRWSPAPSLSPSRGIGFLTKAIGSDGSVGIWHESYLVPAGQYETVYSNMPAFGLAAASEHVPATGRRATARRRLGGDNELVVPTTEAEVHEYRQGERVTGVRGPA
jgi:hypothetical protein